MTALADAQGTLARLFQRMMDAAPVAWRHDPLFRGASVGAGVTLALLLLRVVGPHDAQLEARPPYYGPGSGQTYNTPRPMTASPSPLAPPMMADVPKIAPGQPLNPMAPVPVPGSGDHFGTFTPGKHP